ncbi:ROK family protein [Agromyces atrinae]|uniref:Putative NBD/HSP70 family sugar kinase n=1 Tax=Agromyces atrinae TaxID=592376 RepID=A0A4Q2MBJ2_9MICO|nr:ROK family protein [Agromyces atrinae]NYD66784.1 putative NBD/HSP70 family sugar kinase [Agromyces atrinae]RXZ87441.1 ROK family protein [Agromyces atrinae]
MRLGIDIGGTKTAAVAMTGAGGIVDQVRLPTGFGASAVVDTAVQTVRRMSEITGIDAGSFESIGIGIPGAVDTATGRVEHAVNLGFGGLDLGPRLAAVFGAPVRVENDVKAAALGASLLLGTSLRSDTDTGAPPTSMAYLNLGTGLAAGVVLGGQLWRGSGGIAGEIGHLPVDPRGEQCACGQRGCLELVASGSAIARLWPTAAALPARDLFDAADRGDERAVTVRQTFIDGVAAAVRVLVLTTDVETVVVGGGLSALGDRLLIGVRATLARRAAQSPFIASLALPDRVRLLPSGFPAAAVGAALVGMS